MVELLSGAETVIELPPYELRPIRVLGMMSLPVPETVNLLLADVLPNEVVPMLWVRLTVCASLVVPALILNSLPPLMTGFAMLLSTFGNKPLLSPLRIRRPSPAFVKVMPLEPV